MKIDHMTVFQILLVVMSSISAALFLCYLQTIRFPNQTDYSLEVCTCVCKIQEESPAHVSGLQIGNDLLFSYLWVALVAFLHVSSVLESVVGMCVLKMLIVASAYLYR